MQHYPPWQPLEPAKPKKFWLVKGRAGPSSVEHPSVDSARAEAKRLARLHPGQPFYVCETVEMVIKHDVEVVSMRERCVEPEDGEIPF